MLLYQIDSGSIDSRGRGLLTSQSGEDAFQQLVGDGLKEAFGGAAKTVPTKGQDGSIDAWVEMGAPEVDPFLEMQGPIIIECKDHDDALEKVADNILSGWYAVRSKLKGAAENEWVGLNAPWKNARSYVYCVSSRITIELRQSLEAKLRKLFLEEIPEEHRPPIETVRVLDWGDLRAWLGQYPRLLDEWLGVGKTGILSHTDYVAGLVGFRGFLLPEQLPFVYPPQDDPSHPDVIYQRLCEFRKPTASLRGILVVGSGGVGKSRTSLQVAELAQQDGWRVLHIQPTDSILTVEDLAPIVLSSNEPVLLVFDYLDQMDFDLGAFRRSLLPDAASRHLPVAILANSRPRWVLEPIPDRDELLQRLDLQPSPDQQQAILHRVVETVAPSSVEALGQVEVLRLCGQRPIIALLIARLIERKVLEGAADPSDFKDLRAGDLGDWLRRRLASDDLLPKPAKSVLEPNRPEANLLAAAAALAVAPSPKPALVGAASSTLQQRPGSNPENAEFLVGILEDLGWLETYAGLLSTAHDVVADEILDQSIHQGTMVFDSEIAAILSGALADVVMIKRFAVAFDRVLGAIDSAVFPKLKESLSKWLKEKAEQIGQKLPALKADTGGYALGAVLNSECWGEAVEQEWGALISLWLKLHGSHHGARHVIYIGLRSELTTRSEDIADAGLKWLDSNRKDQNATFVLAPLLKRDISDPSTIVSAAMDWLEVEGHSALPDARFVLGPLLGRADLGASAADATRHAIAWLDIPEHSASPDAQFVLHSLLGRADLGDSAADATRHAIAWLDIPEHSASPDAGFVLGPLLGRADLGAHAADATRHAIAWLDIPEHSASPDAGFVLHSLLGRADLGDSAADATRHAIAWLDIPEHSASPDARFVLHSLLGRADLGDSAADATRHAIAWLDIPEHSASPDAGFVLGPLLGRADLGAHAADATRHAIAWLDIPEHSASPDARFVLKALLGRADLGAHAADATRHAIAWLDIPEHSASPDAGFVLKALLGRADLGDSAADATRHAIAWLDIPEHSASPDAGFVLGPLLGRADLGAHAADATRHAIAWLDIPEHSASPDARFVLKALLGRADLGDSAADATRHAIAWLDIPEHSASPDAQFVLHSLLGRADLGDSAADATRHAIAWLDIPEHSASPDAQFVLHSLLGRADLGDSAADATRHAIAWLDIPEHSASPDARFVLKALLGRADLGDSAADATRHAIAWLDIPEHSASPDAGFVLGPLLGRSDLKPDIVAGAVQIAIGWLRVEKHRSSINASFVTSPLLDRSDLVDEVTAEVIKIGMDWLECHGSSLEAGFVLNSILGRNEIDLDMVDLVKKYSNAWLKRNHSIWIKKSVKSRLDERFGIHFKTKNPYEQSNAFGRLFAIIASSEISFVSEAFDEFLSRLAGEEPQRFVIFLKSGGLICICGNEEEATILPMLDVGIIIRKKDSPTAEESE